MPDSRFLLATMTLASTIIARPTAQSSSWPGWNQISHMFVFGDSYTTTGFNDTGAQPSIDNPLGNPTYPGYTSSNGPNWVDFLTTTYNQSFLKTVNLAYGGATVDGGLIAPYEPTVLSVKQQIEDEYLPVYSQKPKFFPWTSQNTLFANFIGINDVGNAYYTSNASDIFAAVWTEYTGLIERLYETGARNFLFLSVPPVDRSPLTNSSGSSAQASEKTTIEAWNANLTSMAEKLRQKHTDATVFLFDYHALFAKVLDAPDSFPQTAAYRNTTTYCASYENGTPDWYTLDAECGIPVDEYFWLNDLHPTFRMHNVTAAKVAKMLEAGPSS